MTRLAVCLAGFVVVAGGCELERSRDFSGNSTGEIHLTVTDGGAPVVGAVAFIEGTLRTAVTDADGKAFLRAAPDDRGNPVAIPIGDYVVRVTSGARAALTTAHLRKDIVRGAEKVSISIGTVELGATHTVAGTVTGCDDPDVVCRVVAARTVALPNIDGTDSRDVLLPVEAQSGVRNGAFTLSGIAPGRLTLVAFAAPRSDSASFVDQLVTASRPTRFGTVSLDVAGDANAVTVAVDSDVPAAGVTITAELFVDDIERLSGSASFLIPTLGTDVTAGLGGAISSIFQTTAPVTVFDMNVQSDDGASVKLEHAVALDGVRLLPIALTAADGLGEASDCVPGRGDDDDGDCLCDLIDPFPGCTSNDPADCAVATPPSCP